MTRLLLCAMGFFLCTVSFSQKIALINSGEVIDEAKASIDTGNYRLAIDAFLKVPERDTNYFYMLSELAQAYNGDKQPDKALEVCEKGLGQKTIYRASFLRSKAMALEKKGQYEQAVALYEQIISEYPTDHLARFYLGIAHYNKHEYEKARDRFFDVLSIHPFHGGTHLNLGRLSIGEGKKVHAMMSFGVYIGINNLDNQKLVLLNGFVNNEVTDEGSLKVQGENAFEKLDQIIRARVAMDKSFKSSIPVDAAVVRQFELFFQQLNTVNENANDPWVKAYLPFFKAIRDKNAVEPYIYHILSSSSNEQVKKWRKKNEKALNEFFSLANTELRKLRAAPLMPPSLKVKAGTPGWYDDENKLVALGNRNGSDKREGPWLFFYTNGERSAEGSFDSNEEKTGTWKTYYGNGNIKAIENYATGEMTTFYYDGGKHEHYFRKDGEIEGEAKIYFPCGALKEKLTYKGGEAHGPGEVYWVNGKVRRKYNYAAGKLDGPYETFYASGKPDSRYVNKAGKTEGLFVQYSPNGKVLRTGEYRNDELNGPWKYYYANGKPDREGTYANSLGVGEWKFYNERGELIETRTLDNEGKLHGENKFYHKGKPTYVQTYNKDVLVKVIYYDRDGKELFKGGKGDGSFAVKTYYPTGQLNSEGTLRKGKLHGTWKYYFRHGGMRSEFDYEDGNLSGKGVEYFASGQKKSVANYVDDELHGYFQEFYEHGQVKEEGWYQVGNRQQQWLSYYPDGTLEEDSYYLNNEMIKDSYDYSIDGKISTITVFSASGTIESFNNHNSKGEVITTSRVQGPVRIMEDFYKNKKMKARSELHCGEYYGELKRWYPDGSVQSSYAAMNNMREGKYLLNSIHNSVESEGTYLNGVREGLWKGYTGGKPDFTGYYYGGNADSVWTYYFPHGKPAATAMHFMDKRDGLTQLFDGDGGVAVEKIYENGDLISYRVMTAGGKWGEWTPFTGNAVITAYFANGTKSFEEEYKSSKLNGVRRIFFANGKICAEEPFVNGDYNGAFVVNFPNGKVRRKGEYKYDEFHGKVEEFNEDGSLKLVENYRYGYRHGKAIVYNKGAKVKEINFWGGTPDE